VSDSATLKAEALRVRRRLRVAGQTIALDLNASLRTVGDELEVHVSTRVDHRELG
jgi:hypothetical protein